MKGLHKAPLTYKDTENYYYVDEPVYEKYEEVEVDDYCEECGNIKATHTETRGVNLLGYKQKKYKKDALYYMGESLKYAYRDKIVDNILNASTIIESLKSH